MTELSGGAHRGGKPAETTPPGRAARINWLDVIDLTISRCGHIPNANYPRRYC